MCGVFYGTRTYIVRWPIKGISMLDTVYNGDTVLLFKTTKADYGDVIIFYLESEKKYLIKRVIGKAGDTITSSFSEDDNCYHLYRNGKLVDESHIYEPMTADGGYRNTSWTVPDGCYFILGDNRNNSHDSHYGVYAEVSEVQGVAFMRFTGITDFGFLN
jgi:signal peptidase I